MLFVCFHAAIGLVVQLTTHNGGVFSVRFPQCALVSFRVAGKAAMWKKKDPIIMNWFIKIDARVICTKMSIGH